MPIYPSYTHIPIYLYTYIPIHLYTYIYVSAIAYGVVACFARSTHPTLQLIRFKLSRAPHPGVMAEPAAGAEQAEERSRGAEEDPRGDPEEPVMEGGRAADVLCELLVLYESNG